MNRRAFPLAIAAALGFVARAAAQTSVKITQVFEAATPFTDNSMLIFQGGQIKGVPIPPAPTVPSWRRVDWQPLAPALTYALPSTPIPASLAVYKNGMWQDDWSLTVDPATGITVVVLGTAPGSVANATDRFSFHYQE